MPIYEYYCPANHRIYQFYAKTLAQGRTVPKCPDNPRFRMEKVISAFAVGSGEKAGGAGGPPSPGFGGSGGPGSDEGAGPEDARLNAAMASMESEFAGVDENDPRALGRMMRRMADLTGEKMDGEMEEVVRKLEEGADPESLEEQLGGDGDPSGDEEGGDAPKDPKEPRRRLRARRGPPARDPKLYDYG